MTRQEIVAQFSPGPWNTGTDEDAQIVYTSDFDVVADTERADGNAIIEAANARLIAAAPDLLDCFLDIFPTIQASELPLPLRYKFLQTMAKIEPPIAAEVG